MYNLFNQSICLLWKIYIYTSDEDGMYFVMPWKSNHPSIQSHCWRWNIFCYTVVVKSSIHPHCWRWDVFY